MPREYFKAQTVAEYLKQGYAVGGTNGGYIVGPSHKKGGIPLLVRDGDRYKVVAEVEGEEFIFGSSATPQLIARLNILNSRDDERWVKIEGELPNHIATIDCNIAPNMYYHPYPTKLLIIEATKGCFIINKHSTWKHLDLLDRLNKGYPCDPEF